MPGNNTICVAFEVKKFSNAFSLFSHNTPEDNHPVRLLVSARLIQPANSVFFSQQTSTSQPKPAQKPTNEHAECVFCSGYIHNEVTCWPHGFLGPEYGAKDIHKD